ncbi:MAG: hypothetical protein HW383_181 [Candidatus Magasanikbacteria bacterium]|nr:hypothetical protein [Candidatus Magasanikbacteria bacterium]
MFLPIQIFLLLAAFLAIIFGGRRFLRHEINLLVFLIWLLVWLAVGSVAVYPEGSTRLAHALGVGRGADLLIYISLAAIFYMLFRLFLRQERIERDITKIVRYNALSGDKKDDDVRSS